MRLLISNFVSDHIRLITKWFTRIRMLTKFRKANLVKELTLPMMGISLFASVSMVRKHREVD